MFSVSPCDVLQVNAKVFLYFHQLLAFLNTDYKNINSMSVISTATFKLSVLKA